MTSAQEHPAPTEKNKLIEIIIIAGPNGAGKTTFARNYLDALEPEQKLHFLNADEIARTIDKKLPQARKDIRAARYMLTFMEQMVDRRENFMLETTLSGLIYARKIPIWKSKGYHVRLIYLKLPSAEHAIERVAMRVQEGGHDIPQEIIRRRFDKSLLLLDNSYKHLVDEWHIYELNIENRKYALAASGKG